MVGNRVSPKQRATRSWGTGDCENLSYSLSGMKTPANVKKCVICFIKQAAYLCWEGGVLSDDCVNGSTGRAERGAWGSSLE